MGLLRHFGSFLRSFLLAAVIGAVLLEIILRIYNPVYVPLRAQRIELPVNRTFKVTNLHHERVDRDVVNHYNSIGLRGPSPPDDAADYIRIFTVGGSTTACVNLSDGRTWPDLLAKYLAEDLPDRRIWLNNAGINGHSTYGHQVLLESHLANFRPQYIIFLIGINDVGRDDLNSYDADMIGGGERLRDRIIAGSELLSTAQVLYRSFRAYDAGLNRVGDLDLKTLPAVALSPQEHADLIVQHRQTHVPHYQQRVQALVDATRRMGAVPVLVTQPGLMGQGVEPSTGLVLDDLDYGDMGGKANLPASAAWDVLELYNDVLRDMGRTEGIPVIDAARSMPKDFRYYFDWIHYSNDGAVEMARIIESGMLPLLRKAQ